MNDFSSFSRRAIETPSLINSRSPSLQTPLPSRLQSPSSSSPSSSFQQRLEVSEDIDFIPTSSDFRSKAKKRTSTLREAGDHVKQELRLDVREEEIKHFTSASSPIMSPSVSSFPLSSNSLASAQLPPTLQPNPISTSTPMVTSPHSTEQIETLKIDFQRKEALFQRTLAAHKRFMASKALTSDVKVSKPNSQFPTAVKTKYQGHRDSRKSETEVFYGKNKKFTKITETNGSLSDEDFYQSLIERYGNFSKKTTSTTPVPTSIDSKNLSDANTSSAESETSLTNETIEEALLSAQSDMLVARFAYDTQASSTIACPCCALLHRYCVCKSIPNPSTLMENLDRIGSVFMYTHFKELNHQRSSNTGKWVIHAGAKLVTYGQRDQEEIMARHIISQPRGSVMVLYPSKNALTVEQFLSQMITRDTEAKERLEVLKHQIDTLSSSSSSSEEDRVREKRLRRKLESIQTLPYSFKDLAAARGRFSDLGSAPSTTLSPSSTSSTPTLPLGITVVILDATWGLARSLNRRLDRLCQTAIKEQNFTTLTESVRRDSANTYNEIEEDTQNTGNFTNHSDSDSDISQLLTRVTLTTAFRTDVGALRRVFGNASSLRNSLDASALSLAGLLPPEPAVSSAKPRKFGKSLISDENDEKHEKHDHAGICNAACSCPRPTSTLNSTTKSISAIMTSVSASISTSITPLDSISSTTMPSTNSSSSLPHTPPLSPNLGPLGGKNGRVGRIDVAGLSRDVARAATTATVTPTSLDTLPASISFESDSNPSPSTSPLNTTLSSTFSSGGNGDGNSVTPFADAFVDDETGAKKVSTLHAFCVLLEEIFCLTRDYIPNGGVVESSTVAMESTTLTSTQQNATELVKALFFVLQSAADAYHLQLNCRKSELISDELRARLEKKQEALLAITPLSNRQLKRQAKLEREQLEQKEEKSQLS